MEGFELDLSGSGLGQFVGCLKHNKEPSDSIKCRGFFDWVTKYYVLKGTDLWS
jgi:hypothetical protein